MTDEGQVIGYLETDDFAAAVERMQGSDVNARWQGEMLPLFAPLDDATPDRSMRPVPEAFHLD